MSDSTSSTVCARAGTWLTALAIDTALVVVFAMSGRASHTEALDVAGVWLTAWPFLAGLALSWLATRAWRSSLGPVWPGTGLWIGTVVIGMVFRLATGAGAAIAFVIVATLTLGIFLIGWRSIGVFARHLRR
jgi:hypothetical protein